MAWHNTNRWLYKGGHNTDHWLFVLLCLIILQRIFSTLLAYTECRTYLLCINLYITSYSVYVYRTYLNWIPLRLFYNPMQFMFFSLSYPNCTIYIWCKYLSFISLAHTPFENKSIGVDLPSNPPPIHSHASLLVTLHLTDADKWIGIPVKVGNQFISFNGKVKPFVLCKYSCICNPEIFNGMTKPNRQTHHCQRAKEME